MNEAAKAEHGHDHPKHELSYYAKRIYAIRDLLIEKGVVSEKTFSVKSNTRKRARRLTAPNWWRVPGLTPISKLDSSAIPNQLVPKWVSTRQLSTSLSCSKIPNASVTWWFARSVPVIRGRFWVDRPTGTRVSIIGNGQWSTRAGSCASSASIYLMTSKFAYMIARQIYDTWFCLSVRRKPKTGLKPTLP